LVPPQQFADASIARRIGAVGRRVPSPFPDVRPAGAQPARWTEGGVAAIRAPDRRRGHTPC